MRCCRRCTGEWRSPNTGVDAFRCVVIGRLPDGRPETSEHHAPQKISSSLYSGSLRDPSDGFHDQGRPRGRGEQHALSGKLVTSVRKCPYTTITATGDHRSRTAWATAGPSIDPDMSTSAASIRGSVRPRRREPSWHRCHGCDRKVRSLASVSDGLAVAFLDNSLGRIFDRRRSPEIGGHDPRDGMGSETASGGGLASGPSRSRHSKVKPSGFEVDQEIATRPSSFDRASCFDAPGKPWLATD